MILLAGDCTGSAYIFAPQDEDILSNTDHNSNIDTDISKIETNHNKDSIPRYELAFEVECGATVSLYICIYSVVGILICMYVLIGRISSRSSS